MIIAYIGGHTHMTNNLVSEIIKIKTNSLDSYVSKYFAAHLQDKQDILSTFLKNKYLLKVDACIWALVIASDGKYFDELIIDEYPSFEVFKDLRFIVGSTTFSDFVTNECIVRIALSKEFRCIYQISPFRVRNALFFADKQMEYDVICAFKRIVETQMYAGKPIFENCNLTYINEEINLFKAVCNSKKELTFPSFLVFYALHDIIAPSACLEDLGVDSNLLLSEITTIFSDDNVRANFVKIPELLTFQFQYTAYQSLDMNFSFDEILQALTCCSYFSCTTATLRKLIRYIYENYPNRMDELENTLLGYIKNNEFYIEYTSILDLVSLELSLKKFKNPQVFIDAVFDLPIAYALFCDFKKGNESFPKRLGLALRRYHVEFDYIVNLVSQVIDDESREEMAKFQSFKNLFK